MRTWAQLQSKRGKSKTYVYYFTQEPPVVAGQPSRGATHTAEIQYVFNNSTPGMNRALADTMSSYWVNFAAKGDPNGKGLPTWPVYRDKLGRAMILGEKIEAESTPDIARLGLFDSLYAKLMAR